MASDLHQPGPRCLRVRPPGGRAALLSFLLCQGSVLLGLGALTPQSAARGQDAGLERVAPPAGPRPCHIDGRASFAGLRVVRSARHGRPRVVSMDLEAREVSVEAITPSLFRVRTREGEPVVEGVARARPPLSLRRDVTLPGLVALRGTPVGRLTPREDALDVDLELGDGVVARRIILRCDALRVRAIDAPETAIAALGSSPRWSSRGATLPIRDRAEEGIEATRVGVPSALVLSEVGRTEAWVHVRATLPRGRLDGWVRDTLLVPVR